MLDRAQSELLILNIKIMNESWFLKCINALNPVMHYGLKVCPNDKKDEFRKKWNDLREFINSWR